MTLDEVISLIETERECVLRQDTPKCQRYEHEGCLRCDLCKDTEDVIEAYNKTILILRDYQKIKESLDD